MSINIHTNTQQQGFITFLIVCLIAFATLFIIKDDTGVSYLKKIYTQIHYYVVDRNKEALEKTTDTKKTMQAHQYQLQKMMDENK